MKIRVIFFPIRYDRPEDRVLEIEIGAEETDLSDLLDDAPDDSFLALGDQFIRRGLVKRIEILER